MLDICSPSGTTDCLAASKRICSSSFVALLLLAAGSARAQGLPQLTITALSVTSERTSAPEGRAFHLTIHLHARQHGADLSSLILPDVVNLSILGDEKHTTPVSGDGTDYIEILTVAGVAPGEATVSPAYIDARDPTRNDKPFRFSSNALRIKIASTSQNETFSWRQAARKVGLSAAQIVIAVAVLVTFGFMLVRARSSLRRRRSFVTLPRARPVTVRAAPATIDRAAEVRSAASALSAQLTRERAAALRAALFAFAGARHDETLSSLLERVPDEQQTLRAALRMAERATFVDEAHLGAAIEDVLDAMRRMGWL